MVCSIQPYVACFFCDYGKRGWFSPVSYACKYDRNDITEILLKVELHTSRTCFHLDVVCFCKNVKLTLNTYFICLELICLILAIPSNADIVS